MRARMQRRRLLLACLTGIGALSTAWLAPVLAQTAGGAQRRSALVIGNAEYAFGRLRNPVNDARAMAGTLHSIGFDTVKLEDADLPHMLDAMKDFVARAKDSAVRLFFYAGHGIQARGSNYLVPVDVGVIDEPKLSAQMVSVLELVDKLGSLAGGVNLVILDACRTGVSGAASRRRGADGKRSANAGLAQMNAPRGTLIAFSTAPGSVALDGEDANSAYTKHLVEAIGVPGLPVEQVFKRVRVSVARETQQAQIPWETSSLMGDFCFRADPSGVCANATADVTAGASNEAAIRRQ